MRRQFKAILSLAGVIIFTLAIHSYIQKNQVGIDYPDDLYGIPTYPGSRLSYPMSALNTNPYTAVFLTNDSYQLVLDFYKNKLEVPHKELKYGKGSVVVMTVYQFEMKKGILTNQIDKGVEIIPLNSFNQRVYKAKTKIKIFLPLQEVKEINERGKKLEESTGEESEGSGG